LFLLPFSPMGPTEASKASQFAKVKLSNREKPWHSNWVELWNSDGLEKVTRKAESRVSSTRALRPYANEGYMSKAEYILRGQYALGALGAAPAIRHDSANGIELCGSYRSDLQCASGWLGRSSADALPHRIRMHEARRNPSPPGCRKHNRLGKLHARRILCRQTERRSRALLGSASGLVSFERKAIAP
jgi:hypothetical protein